MKSGSKKSLHRASRIKVFGIFIGVIAALTVSTAGAGEIPSVAPEKDIVGIFLTQKMMDDRVYYNEFITLTYQALME